MKTIYDISVLGLHQTHENNKTGIYRVVESLLYEFIRIISLELYFSHIEYYNYYEESKQYLKENNINTNLVNSFIKFLPTNINGNGKKYFNFLYQILNINPCKLKFNKELVMQANIFHTPFNKIPNDLKNYKKLKRVVTIYDLIPILYPNLHTMTKQINDTISSIGNDFAICISECTRQDLLNYNKNINSNHVFVSQLAASNRIFYKCNDKDKFNQIQKKYKIPDKYFLSLSTLEPRKNIDHVIRCFIRFIKQQNIKNLSLVLVGNKGWMFDKIFEEFENSNELKPKIIITGRIPDEDLASLYSNAHSFYFMSLYEGFGLPPLEAMQCGVATVTSNTSSLPEVVGDAGIMLAPNDEDALCQTMVDIYYDDNIRTKYQIMALNQAKKFSWEKCAQQHLEIYNKIIAV